MVEKFNSPQSGSLKNRPAALERPAPEDLEEDTSFVPDATEETVLAHMQEAVDHHGPEGARDPAVLESLHSGVEHCECYPMFKKYVRGEVPSIERLFGGIGAYTNALDAIVSAADPADPLAREEAEIASALSSILKGREAQIRMLVERYVRSVIRFHNLRLRSADGTRDLKRQFVDADEARRRAHNALIDSLRVYQEAVNRCKEEGFDNLPSFRFFAWEKGFDAQQAPQEGSLYFAPSVLADRNFLRDWAIASEFLARFRALGDGEWIAKVKSRSV